uniref:Mediator of RNA polymerase II transcription subunit 21 n=1 Tax=Anthurium amnicola TaxID=1678845 RepID=A0A1D1XXP8_9ARAE
MLIVADGPWQLPTSSTPFAAVLLRSRPPLRSLDRASLSDDSLNIAEQPKLMSAALFQAAKQFDILVAALPLSEGGEEAQLRRIAELEAENEAVGEELQKQLEAAERELRQIQELFSQASDNCLNLKRLD